MSIIQFSIRSALQATKFSFCSIKVVNRQTKKQIAEENDRKNINPLPKSPILGPITVQNLKDPVISNKKYRWCSCGNSKEQPLCDGSHEGTLFKPYRFTIEQECKEIQLCGCKLTKNKPFCDGETCKSLQS